MVPEWCNTVLYWDHIILPAGESVLDKKDFLESETYLVPPRSLMLQGRGGGERGFQRE